jgi:hypothetical protein
LTFIPAEIAAVELDVVGNPLDIRHLDAIHVPSVRQLAADSHCITYLDRRMR